MAVALSGGVDSTFLLSEAHGLDEANNQIIAVTADSPLHLRREVDFAKRFCIEQKIRHVIVSTSEMQFPEFLSNPPNRCYLCKSRIFSSLFNAARQHGIAHVAHGVNMDDLAEYRPGLKAAEEMGVLSPLAEAGLTKSEIRWLSKQKGLSNWCQPSSGCLATRIPYGHLITLEKLHRIESAEHVLANLGFLICRVRCHEDLAKIEVPSEDFEKIMAPSMRAMVVAEFKKIGFRYISLDMESFTSGRLDRVLIMG